MSNEMSNEITNETTNLDNLISKIVNDANQKAQQIKNENQEKVNDIIENSKIQDEKISQAISQKAKEEADRVYSQTILEQDLKIRDMLLDAKVKSLDKVFGEAVEKLNNLELEPFLEFVKNSLLSMETQGKDIVFPFKYNIIDVSQINDFLIQNGKKGGLSLSKSGRNIDGGFILINENIEEDNTFASLVSFNRYNMESEIAKILF